MINREEALLILKKFKENEPNNFFNRINDHDVGMTYVMLYLSENKNAYANTIANDMGVSRARIAVLLNKLDNKGYIKKEPSSSDKRIEVISLTDSGLNYINQIRENVVSTVIRVVNEIGIADINSFLDTAAKIKKLLKNE